MPLSVDASVMTPFRSTAPKPVWLVEVATGLAAPTHLRYTSFDRDVTFGSNVFTKRPLRPGELSVAVQTDQRGTTVEIADLDGAIQALIAAGASFSNSLVKLWLTDVAATGGATTYGYVGAYFVDTWTQQDGRVAFQCSPLLATFGLNVPRRVMTRTLFPGLPKESP